MLLLRNEEFIDLYTGKNKQPLHRRKAQHWRDISSGQDSAVHLRLKEKGHSFQDTNVYDLAREERWRPTVHDDREVHTHLIMQKTQPVSTVR